MPAATAGGLSFATGAAGEQYLARLLGAGAGDVQRTFTLGRKRRVVDVLADGIAHESKVGYVEWKSFYKWQIIKDYALRKSLRATREVRDIHWHFFRSEVTGRVGADPRILRMLERLKIGYTIYE